MIMLECRQVYLLRPSSTAIVLDFLLFFNRANRPFACFTIDQPAC